MELRGFEPLTPRCERSSASPAAVLIDASLVRMILLPAAMELLRRDHTGAPDRGCERSKHPKPNHRPKGLITLTRSKLIATAAIIAAVLAALIIDDVIAAGLGTWGNLGTEQIAWRLAPLAFGAALLTAIATRVRRSR